MLGASMEIALQPIGDDSYTGMSFRHLCLFLSPSLLLSYAFLPLMASHVRSHSSIVAVFRCNENYRLPRGSSLSFFAPSPPPPFFFFSLVLLSFTSSLSLTSQAQSASFYAPYLGIPAGSITDVSLLNGNIGLSLPFFFNSCFLLRSSLLMLCPPPPSFPPQSHLFQCRSRQLIVPQNPLPLLSSVVSSMSFAALLLSTLSPSPLPLPIRPNSSSMPQRLPLLPVQRLASLHPPLPHPTPLPMALLVPPPLLPPLLTYDFRSHRACRPCRLNGWTRCDFDCFCHHRSGACPSHSWRCRLVLTRIMQRQR